MRVLPLLLLWLAGAVYVAWTAHLPIPYRHGGYPLYEVAREVLYMACETVALIATLKPRTYSRSWARALRGFLIALAFFLFAFPLADSAWPYDDAFLLWLLGVAAMMLLVTAWSGIAALRLRHGT